MPKRTGGRVQPGERYRLGYGRRGDDWVRDDWTGVEVTLVEPFEQGEAWLCELGVEQVFVSEERLRAAALLGLGR